jgi:hypothetical protein
MMLPMIRPRTVVLIGVVSLAAGWMAGTSSSPATQEAPAQRRAAPRPLGMSATSTAPYTAQLRRKLEEQPRTPVPGRNPFVFGSRRPYAAAPISRGRSTAAEPEPESRPAPPPPAISRFKLSGIAATEKDGAVVLTAIVIDSGSMIFAKAGDKLSGGHSVLRVEEKAIVLVDASGVEQILRLP